MAPTPSSFKEMSQRSCKSTRLRRTASARRFPSLEDGSTECCTRGERTHPQLILRLALKLNSNQL